MSKRAIFIKLQVAAMWCFSVWTLAGQPSDPEALLAQVAVYEHGQSRAALVDLAELVSSSLSSPAQVRELEQRFIKLLQSNATLAGKDFICRQLSVMGTEASVGPLEGMLLGPATSEMARYALERIPGAAVNEALRNALPKASGKVKIGIINTLGRRRDPKAVAGLGGLIYDSDPAVAGAAVAAVGQIGGQAAAKALTEARGKTSGALRRQVLEAALECAGQLVARGDRKGALPIYRELYAASEPEMVRVAALTGLAATAGKESVTLLSQAIEGPEERIQAVAIRLLNQMPGPEITRMLIEQLPKLSATGQVRVLAALADRGDTSARPALLGAMKSGAPEVRIAGLEGLGRLGDASTVNLLAEAAARAEGAEQNAARESLARLRGAEVDRAIAAGIGAAGGNVRLELVRAAGERGPSAAAEVLLKTARDSDRELRRESLRALRDTASGQQAPALVDLLISAPSASDRREAERTLASVLRRSEGARINAVLSAYRSAQDLEARGSLLQVMGQTGNNEALPVLRDALRDGNPEIKRAAILALTEWPDPAPIEDLLEIARNDSSATHQVLALRGYIKLISIPAGRSATDMAKLLAEAMKAARQPDEKKAVLSLLPRYASKEALELAQAALSDEAVANEAKLAVERLKKSLGGR